MGGGRARTVPHSTRDTKLSLTSLPTNAHSVCLVHMSLVVHLPYGASTPTTILATHNMLLLAMSSACTCTANPPGHYLLPSGAFSSTNYLTCCHAHASDPKKQIGDITLLSIRDAQYHQNGGDRGELQEDAGFRWKMWERGSFNCKLRNFEQWTIPNYEQKAGRITGE